MVGIVLLAFWFMGVCLYLLLQQWTGEISGQDV